MTRWGTRGRMAVAVAGALAVALVVGQAVLTSGSTVLAADAAPRPGVLDVSFGGDGTVRTVVVSRPRGGDTTSGPRSDQFGVTGRAVAVRADGTIIPSGSVAKAFVPRGAAPHDAGFAAALLEDGDLLSSFGAASPQNVQPGIVLTRQELDPGDEDSLVLMGPTGADLDSLQRSVLTGPAQADDVDRGGSAQVQVGAVMRLTPDGSFDPGFGQATTAGDARPVILELGSAATTTADVVVDDLDRIVVAGVASQLVGERGDVRDELFITRLLPDGTPDPSFGADDGVTVVGGSASAHMQDGDNRFAVELGAVALAPGGSILVAGTTQVDSSGGRRAFVARFDADGQPDPTFAADSVLGPGFVLLDSDVVATDVLADGAHVLVAGHRGPGDGAGVAVVVRVAADGSLDAGWADAGVATPFATTGPVSGAGGLALDGDQVVVVGHVTLDGRDDTDIALARLTADGTLDPTFGLSNGVTVTGSPDAGERAEAVTVDPLGRIVLTGSIDDADGISLLTARYGGGTTQPGPTPTVAVTPESGRAGADVEVETTGFDPTATVQIWVAGVPTVARAVLGEGGVHRASVTIPVDAELGPLTIGACQPDCAPDGPFDATTTFEVTELGPSVAVTPDRGAAGSVVEVVAEQFDLDGEVEIWVGGAPVARAVPGEDDVHRVSVTIPVDAEPGPLTIGACQPDCDPEDPVFDASTTFVVEESSPEVRVVPGAGPPGTPVVVTATGFDTGAAVEVRLGGGVPLVATPTIDGEHVVDAVVPEDAAPGSELEVVACQPECGDGAVLVASTTFEVTESVDPGATPVVWSIPAEAEPGTEVQVRTENFAADSTVRVLFDGVPGEPATPTGDGVTHATTVTVPVGTPDGEYVLTACQPVVDCPDTGDGGGSVLVATSVVVVRSPVVPPLPPESPTLRGTPSEGPPGTVVALEAEGFGVEDPVEIWVAGELVARAVLGEGGVHRVSVTVPVDAELGPLTIGACQSGCAPDGPEDRSVFDASTTFLVTGAGPRPGLPEVSSIPSTTRPGDELAVEARNFAASAPVVVLFDGLPAPPATPTGDGVTHTTTLTVPEDITVGNYVLVACQPGCPEPWGPGVPGSGPVLVATSIVLIRATEFPILTPSPSLGGTPSEGPPGTEVALEAEGFDVERPVEFRVDGTPATTSPFGEDGVHTASVTIPADAEPGTEVSITACQPDCVTDASSALVPLAASTTFVVVGPPSRTVSVTPAAGPAGTVVEAVAGQFDLDGEVEIWVGGAPVARAVPGEGDVHRVSLTIPVDAEPGPLTIGACQPDCDPEDPVFDASTTFIVEAPPLLGTPTISGSPVAGPAGRVMEVVARNFDIGVSVAVSIAGSPVGEAVLSGDGTHGAIVVVPEDLPIGVHELVGCQDCDGPDPLVATSSIEVTDGDRVDRGWSPELLGTPAAGRAGSTVALVASGFDPESSVSISMPSLDGETWEAVWEPDVEGHVATVVVPEGTPDGSLLLRACQLCARPDGPFATTTFTVRSERRRPPRSSPTASIEPARGLAGTAVVVTGRYFDVTGPVSVLFDGEEVATALSAPGSPLHVARFDIPVTATPGRVEVRLCQACGEGDERSASTTFEVISDEVPVTTMLTATPEEGPIGTVIGLTATGFDGSRPVDLVVGETASTAEPTEDGTHVGEIEIPEGTPGGPLEVRACQPCGVPDSPTATATVLVTPRLFASPSVARPGEVILVTGDGLPADTELGLVWLPGIGAQRVRTDAAGEFQAFVLVMHKDTLGPRELVLWDEAAADSLAAAEAGPADGSAGPGVPADEGVLADTDGSAADGTSTEPAEAAAGADPAPADTTEGADPASADTSEGADPAASDDLAAPEGATAPILDGEVARATILVVPGSGQPDGDLLIRR